MEKYGNLSKEQQNIVSNFFGKQTLEYTCSDVTSYWQDSLAEENMKYEIVKKEGNSLEIKYHAREILGGITTKRITLIDDCYYLPLERFTFSEVFCRVK